MPLEGVGTITHQEIFVNFYVPDACQAWLKNNNADLFLFDYEFIGNKQTGIDFIREQKLPAQKTVLVTSRYDENHVRQNCESLGIGLLPKGLAIYIPIKIKSTANDLVDSELKIKNVSILIDDDSLLRMVWETTAKDKNIELITYEDHLVFMNELDKFCKKSCMVYIDSNLKNGFKGEELARSLYDMGFKNLYMETGYEASQFAHLDFLKGVMGKNPPW